MKKTAVTLSLWEMLATGLRAVATSAFLLTVFGPVQALPLFEISFQASGFSASVGSVVAPQDPVAGSIVFEAVDENSPINALVSVSLTINEHTYGLSELEFTSPFFVSDAFVGGAVDGLTGTLINENDFAFAFDYGPGTVSPTQFTYTSAGFGGSRWMTSTFDAAAIAPVSVPEPTTLALVGLALLVGAAATRKWTWGRHSPLRTTMK
ncbi:MAG: PEP-CTERM sorting domain-containing protein [Burkholderiaceae bacterium]|nr:PEP-CTERM sorting domain-containing protein [Burkholderiaceae bacterium]